MAPSRLKRRTNPPGRRRLFPKRALRRTVMPNQPALYQRKLYKATLQSSATGTISGAYSFTLDDMTNYGELQALFDQYKITHVQVVFVPKYNMSNVTDKQLPILHVFRDYDDATAPSLTLNTFLENTKVKSRVLDKPVSISLSPASLTEVYRGPATTSYSPKWNQWIDMAHADVDHYGIKYLIEDNGFAASEDICDIYFTMTVSLRGWR